MNPSKHAQMSFQGTRWSVVIAAKGKDSPDAERALSALCAIYWYPLYAFVRRSGCSHHKAEDMTQGFFCKLLSKDGLVNVDPEKGKFRTFLLVSMKHFLANERERAQAIKRGGDVTFLSIDMTDGEGRYEWEPVDSVTPDVLYERSWAMTLLNSVLMNLKTEYEAKGKTETFEALEHFVSGSSSVSSYAEVANLLKTSEGNIKVLVHRIRRRFGDILRERVANTVESESEIDGEITHLMSCFGK